MQAEWNHLIHSYIKQPPEPVQEQDLHPSITGALPIALLQLALPALLPSVRDMGWYTTKYIAQKALQSSIHSLSSTLPYTLISSMISVPVSLFTSHANKNNNVINHTRRSDSIILDASANFHDDNLLLHKGIPLSTKNLLIGLGAVGTLFFEYMGTQAMVNETKRNKLILTSDDSLSITTQLKKQIYQRYKNSSKSYYDDPQKGLFILKEMDPVRIVYNVLVGVNTVLFKVHWTSIFIYLEILARLVNLHGWTPVRAANKIHFSKLLASKH